MDQKLADLLEKKRRQSTAAASVDWDERRDEYLRAVSDLYTRIEEMLAGPIGDGAVAVQRRSKNLTENYIGTYAVDDLVLSFGDERVRFSPRGRNILGAEGRIDVVGDRGEATLILRGADWLFLQARQPELRVAPLNESVFADMLNVVMRN